MKMEENVIVFVVCAPRTASWVPRNAAAMMVTLSMRMVEAVMVSMTAPLCISCKLHDNSSFPGGKIDVCSYVEVNECVKFQAVTFKNPLAFHFT